MTFIYLTERQNATWQGPRSVDVASAEKRSTPAMQRPFSERPFSATHFLSLHVSQFPIAPSFTTVPTLNMMSTTIQRIGRSAKTPIAAAIDQAVARQAKSAFSTVTINHFSGIRNSTSVNNTFPIQIRALSLQALDMAAVRQIKAELMEVDALGNGDGRYAR